MTTSTPITRNGNRVTLRSSSRAARSTIPETQPGTTGNEISDVPAPTIVLVIDDQLMIRLLCRVNLEAEGMEVIEADDGCSGLETARECRPDVVLLNVMMPGLSGWAVGRELLADEQTCQIPIIFLTARRKPRDRLYGLKLGAVDYLTKPFHPLELAPRIRAILARIARGEREELRREKLAEARALLRAERRSSDEADRRPGRRASPPPRPCGWRRRRRRRAR